MALSSFWSRAEPVLAFWGADSGSKRGSTKVAQCHRDSINQQQQQPTTQWSINLIINRQFNPVFHHRMETHMNYVTAARAANPLCQPCSCGNGSCAIDCENDCTNWDGEGGQDYVVDERDIPNVEEDQDSDNEWDIDYPEEESSAEQDDYESDLGEEESDKEGEESKSDEGESYSDDEDCLRDAAVLLNQLHNDVASTEDILLDDEDGIFLSEESSALGDIGSHEVDLKVWN